MQDLPFLPVTEFTIELAAVQSGLYVTTGLLLDVVSDIQRSGFRVFQLDGNDIIDRSSYLQAMNNLFEFGAHFGRNWDALADSLTDLPWGEDDRIVVLYSDCEKFAKHNPEAWAIAMEIWQSSVVFWQAQGVKLSIVFQVGG